jgi:hypothetical protein
LRIAYIYYLKLNLNFKIFLVVLVTLTNSLYCQTKPFKEGIRWGIKDGNQVIINPVYDTIFNFDETGKVCLACRKMKGPSNKIIKVTTYTYACNYLNKKGEKLRIKAFNNDTCSIFSLGKNTINQYSDAHTSFAVSVKNAKYLVDKEFKQLTFNEYYDVAQSVEPMFYSVSTMDESETILTGLVDLNEHEVIPIQFAHIRINPVDSLIMGCSAGVRINSDDDIFNYAGKKMDSYHRHVEMATKDYIIHKVFTPKEHFVIYNIKTKEEKNLQANEIHFFDHEEILIRIRDDWYVYNLKTNLKTPKQY